MIHDLMINKRKADKEAKETAEFLEAVAGVGMFIIMFGCGLVLAIIF